MPERTDAAFRSRGESCAAWHLPAEGRGFEAEGGRPCVVMAHGLGGTRDSGLLPFAEAFAAAGLEVVLFDYRSFGASSGQPRQVATPESQRDDYRAAVRFARELDGVDPRRIVLWGTSWSGGHVVHVAADDPRVAAVVSQTPDLDGRATMRWIARSSGARHSVRLGAVGMRDLRAARRGDPPVLVPIVGRPGELAILTSEDALPGYEAIAGPSWRNEIAARAVLHELRNRAVPRMAELRCPVLIQVAQRDSLVPAGAAEAGAWEAKGRSEMRTYPCGHFDIYVGEWRDHAIADQLRFLRRHLGAERPS